MPADSLKDFTRSVFTSQGRSAPVYRLGHGPAVIVVSEMPGITPKVADFARRIAEIGCTAVLPHMFGRDGADPLGGPVPALTGVATSLRALAPVCVSREFVVFAAGRTSPIVGWLRQLATVEHRRCGGPGVGAVGMCFTGGFALAMAVDDTVVASVLSQPSLPVPLTRRLAAALDISNDDLDVVADRCAGAKLCVLGLRFRGDKLSPATRFDTLRSRLGDAFTAVELPRQSANPAFPGPAHSVLTEGLIDAPGEPTHEALHLVLTLLTQRLLPDHGAMT